MEGTVVPKKKSSFSYKDYPSVDYATFGTPKNQAKVNHSQPVQILQEGEIHPIELEDAATSTIGRSDVYQTSLLKKRVDKTIENGINVGKAFPIPAKSRSTIYEYLKTRFPEMKFGLSYHKGQPFARVIRKA